MFAINRLLNTFLPVKSSSPSSFSSPLPPLRKIKISNLIQGGPGASILEKYYENAI